MRTRIKFCGCTTVRDAELSVACGVDAIGVIFAAQSPRRVSMDRAREIAQAMLPFVALVAVFVEPTAADVNAARAAGYVPQFSGMEPAQQCEVLAAGSYIKVHHLPPGPPVPGSPAVFAEAARDYLHATWLFDTAVDGKLGGTGCTFDWASARRLAGERPFIISGGLTPENVALCVSAARPYAVDVRSGIEANGVKDLSKMRAFVRAVKEVDDQA